MPCSTTSVSESMKRSRPLFSSRLRSSPAKRQVAVVAGRDLAIADGDQKKRLAFAQRNFSGGGITDGDQSAGAGQSIEGWLIESFRRHSPIARIATKTLAVGPRPCHRIPGRDAATRTGRDKSGRAASEWPLDAKHAHSSCSWSSSGIDHARFGLSRIRNCFQQKLRCVPARQDREIEL